MRGISWSVAHCCLVLSVHCRSYSTVSSSACFDIKFSSPHPSRACKSKLSLGVGKHPHTTCVFSNVKRKDFPLPCATNGGHESTSSQFPHTHDAARCPCCGQAGTLDSMIAYAPDKLEVTWLELNILVCAYALTIFPCCVSIFLQSNPSKFHAPHINVSSIGWSCGWRQRQRANMFDSDCAYSTAKEV